MRPYLEDVSYKSIKHTTQSQEKIKSQKDDEKADSEYTWESVEYEEIEDDKGS